MCAVDRISNLLDDLAQGSATARLAFSVQAVLRFKEQTSDALAEVMAVWQGLGAMEVDGHEDEDEDGDPIATRLCRWWRQLHDALAAARPHLEPRGGGGRHEQHDRMACAVILHRMLCLGASAVACANVALQGEMLPLSALNDAEAASMHWFDTVVEPLRLGRPAETGDDDDQPLEVMYILDELQIHVARLFAHGIGQHVMTRDAIEGMLAGDSVDVTCARVIAATVTELCAPPRLWPTMPQYLRLARTALRELEDALRGRATVPEWLAQALAAVAALAKRVEDGASQQQDRPHQEQEQVRLHPAVLSTLRKQPDCVVCSSPLDVLDIVVLPCWRPPPPHGDATLHSCCGKCLERWQVTCVCRGRAEEGRANMTCPMCRSPLPIRSALHAEDVSAWYDAPPPP